MRLLKSLLFIGLFQPFFIFCQTEGWVNTCLNITPKVVEAMIDACGNQEEFYREYVVFKTGTSPYNIQNLAYKVTNPFNNAFVGSVKIDDLSTDPTIFQKLNAAVSSVCDYGISFRDVLAAPYFGTVPQDAILLVFNNKDLDLNYLTNNILPSLCGSKVFVALGTLKSQSPGAAIFRNFPKNRSCGNTGCLRRIDFQYDGVNAPFCEEMTYDIKRLTSPAVIRPGDEFGDGSYIRPQSSTTLEYGGGGPTGVNTTCMPPEKLLCTVPPAPDYGNGFWNVLAFDDATFTNFKGFYQAKSGHTPSVLAPTGSFEYNTARDGWKPHEAPSEAHPTYGALTAYEGCNTKADTFSILAKRKGFPCGDYTLRLLKYDDHVRIKIDADGDGTFEFIKSFDSPACSNGCDTDIWTGFLGANSKMQIFGIDNGLDFQTQLLFTKKNTSPIPLKISASTTPTPCGSAPVGAITLSVAGGNSATYSWTWAGPTPIPNNSISANNLSSGVYSVIVKDANGCQDSARFMVAQTNSILPVIAKKDTAFCAGGIASLRGLATGGTGALTYEWTTADGKFISNQAITTYTPYQNTELVFKATDASGCFKTDTMKVTINQLPYITIRSDIPDTICNNTRFTMKVSGANSFTWAANWTIGTVNYIFTRKTPNEDSVEVNAFGLPAPFYIYTATGTDGNGCVNTAQKRFTLIPLPIVTINPLTNTIFCNNDNPIKVSGTPATGGKFYAVFAATGAPCVGCMIGQTFYPTLSGPGQFNIVHELTDDKGCVNGPRVYLEVKSCVVNPCPPDILNLTAKTCDPAKVGVVTQNLKKFNGCDSTVITTTTLSLPNAVLVNGSSCNPLDTGTFVKKLVNQNGCDSIVTTKIALLAKSETRLNANTCDPSVVGEKTVTLKNKNGCDSLVITTYTLAPSVKNTINLSTCNPADTGTFVKNLKNYLGCDSTVFTVVKLLKSDTIRLKKASCNWQETGDFKAVYKNKNGCDSIIFLTVTLLERDTTYLNAVSCNPLDTGTFEKRLNNFRGCDSIIFTKVSLLKKSETRLTATTCDPLGVGEKTVTLKNQNGCDSLVITTYALSNSASTNLNSTSCNPLDTGVFVKNLKSYLGCDSIVTTKISLLKKSETRLTATTCDPSGVGEKTVTLKNQNGCDSLVITTYALSNNVTTNLNSTSCNPLDTGTFVKNLKSYLGCDSVVTTKISLLKKSETRLTATTCDPSGVGEKTVTLKNQNGCDSLVITTYALSNNVTTNLNSTSCNPLDTGTFVKNLKSYLGCDSIVTIKIKLSNLDTGRLAQTTCDPLKVGKEYIIVRKKSGCDSVVLVVTTLAKMDTTFINLTSCSLTNVGEKIQKYSRTTGCDSIVATRTRYSPTTLVFNLKRSKSISCNRGEDGEIALSTVTGGTPQYKITWSNGDTNSVLKKLAAGKYQATVTDKDGCQKADSLDLKEPSPIEMEIDGISPRCFGEQFGNIEVGTVIGGSPPYTFNVGDVNKPMTVLPYTLSNVRVGRYQVKIFDQNKCFNDTFIDIKEGRLLNINLGNDTKITLGDSVTLNVTSDFTLKNIKWIYDKNTLCDTCLSQVMRPTTTTVYKVKAQDTEGCVAEDAVTIFIDKNKRVYVPNSFSPNGDKTNDMLVVYADQSVEKIITFQVFNRWGSRIFEHYNFQPNDETAGWDGFFKGQLVQPDVVVYFIEVLFKDGKTEVFQGDVTIMK